MFSNLEQILLSFSDHIPLPFFAFLASFVEETIPPIPSPAVMIISGSLASVQNYALWGIILLVLIGSVGKTLGASLVYFIIDKIENIFADRMTKFFGITHEQIESFGAKLGGGPRDYIILTVLRALPIFPSTLISVGGGLLKIRFKLFFISTFVGSVVRGFIYIYLGFLGTAVAISFFKETATTVESFIQIVIVIVLILFLGFLYYKRIRSTNLKN